MNNSDFLISDDNYHLLNRGVTNPIATVQVSGGILLRNVAKIIGVSDEKLQALNPQIIKNIVPPENKKYDIYIPYTTLTRFKENIKNLKPTKFEVYTVAKGDNLAKIAKKYKMKYTLIKKFNKLKTNIISINQKLLIPVDPATIKRDQIYFVKSGDNLLKIAKQHKITLKKLMLDNHLKTSMIHIGDKLVIKYN